ncbi:MAG: metallophosphoesterase [bacterium]
MNILFSLIFLISVIVVSIFMVKYFIHLALKSFGNLAKYKRELKILYAPIFLTFFLFSNRSMEGSYALTLFSVTLYTYFTFIFIFFLYGLLIELFILIRKLFKNAYSKELPAFKRKLMFLVLFLIAFHTVATGFFLAEKIEVVSLKIESPKVEKQTKIVQLSDIHFSAVTGAPFAEKIVETVNHLKPDIIINTGDYVDSGLLEPDKVIKTMNSMNAPLGKFTITGNHEFIGNYTNSKEFVENSGFKLIDNEISNLPGNISLIAVSDKVGKRRGVKPAEDLEILKKADPAKFNIFLKHQPKIKKGAHKLFDLMLSGHTHAGQIVPFNIFVKMAFRYCRGTYKLKSGSKIHVSRGTGTWGPPIRFGANPEITLIELFPSTTN